VRRRWIWHIDSTKLLERPDEESDPRARRIWVGYRTDDCAPSRASGEWLDEPAVAGGTGSGKAASPKGGAPCRRNGMWEDSQPKRRSAVQSDSRTVATNPSGAPAVEVAHELQQPLADLAQASGQSPARIVNLALTEYLERRLRPDRETSKSTFSYVEMTVREELHDIF
jgi:hypothetical protein